MIPPDFVNTLLQRVDIVNLVSKHVDLKKAGSNYLGLCPFHGEKSPSFTVSPQKNFYHCFGCGASGNAINFLKNHLGLNYVESINNLAQLVGIAVPQDNIQQTSKDTPKKDNSLYFNELNNLAQYYQEQLKNNNEAIEYLKARGLTGVVAKKFALGYAPDAWQTLSNLGINQQILLDTGMLINKNNKFYDRFRRRIMFPIRNKDGNTIAYGGRVIHSGEPKYLNSPETILFNKSQTLYGLFENQRGIKQAKKILVVEGYMDVVALHQYGIDYAVATLGTSCTTQHMNLLFRYTDHVIFAFDGDMAGEKAAVRALEKVIPSLKDDKTVEFLFLPHQHDPDSYIRALGVEAFRNAINKAMPLSTFMIKNLTEGHNLKIAEERAKIEVRANTYLKSMPNIFLKKQLQKTIWGLTNPLNKARNNSENNWTKAQFIKNNILKPIEKLMQAMFIQPLIGYIISKEIRQWINYAFPYMDNLWSLCSELYQINEPDKYTQVWLNSSYANYYTRLCKENLPPLNINDELYIEENIQLAKSIARYGISLKQNELMKNIEINKQNNENYELLWQEFTLLNDKKNKL